MLDPTMDEIASRVDRRGLGLDARVLARAILVMRGRLDALEATRASQSEDDCTCHHAERGTWYPAAIDAARNAVIEAARELYAAQTGKQEWDASDALHANLVRLDAFTSRGEGS